MGSLLAAPKITFIDNSPSWQGNVFVKAISRKRKCGNSTENHTDSSCPFTLPAKLSCKAKSLCFWVGNALKCLVCVCSAMASDLTKVAVANATSKLLDLGELLGQSFLLVQLLGESLKLSEGQLQWQPVLMPYRGVFQHVLWDTHRYVSIYSVITT